MEYNIYPFNLDPSTFIFVLAGYGIHIFLVAAQGTLIVYLLLSGILILNDFGQNNKLLRNFGLVSHIAEEKRNSLGSLKIGSGILLLLPSVLGIHFLISGGAALIALFCLIYQEKKMPPEQKRPGALIRGMAISIAALLSIFIFLEGADNIELGIRIFSKAIHYRDAEKAWQLESDTRSPKTGDAAPDFELSDPYGEMTVSLSDFKGRRPVALIFGAHT